MNERIFDAINQWAGQYHWLDTFAIVLTNNVQWVFLAILLILWFTNEENKRTVMLSAITGCLALCISQVISFVYFHPRPFMEHAVHQLVSHAAESSFPSDHATGAFALAFPVLARNKKWGFVMMGLAIATGVSRIFVGVHYPFDIVGGMIVGFLSSLLIIKATVKIEPFLQLVLRLYRKAVNLVPFAPKNYPLD